MSVFSAAGHTNESRRAYRRRTLARVISPDGRRDNVLMTDVSPGGAYIRTDNPLPVGARFVSRVFLPGGANRPLEIGGQVVRTDERGMGVVFEDLQSRDRSLLRGYASFFDLDDAVVSLQASNPGALRGNLLPVGDGQFIRERLQDAAGRDVRILIALSAKGGPWIGGRLGIALDVLILREMERPLPKNTNVIYCAVLDGPLRSVFEGLVVEHGENPQVLFPERMYHNDRRCSRRMPAEGVWLGIPAARAGGEAIRLPVIEASEGGCSVLAPPEGLLAVGMRFPACELSDGHKTSRHEGATVARIEPAQQTGHWRLSLNFIDAAVERDSFSRIQELNTKSSRWASFQRLAGVARRKAADLLGGAQPAENQVHVCRYKNTRGEQVVGLIDATFDLHDRPPQVDVAVLICQPFQVRKETFNLLARTLVDNFRRDGISAVVLRFDMTHMVGESESDPELEARGSFFYKWTYSQYESDMLGGLAFLERRFQPARRVLVSFSVAAIPARRLIADGRKPGVDVWIAPFGCPDGQDQFKFLLAGVDLFQKYLDGRKIEEIYIFGRPADPNDMVRDAVARGMAFLKEAREDMAKIEIPVGWILGTYDFVVTRERVRQMLNAPGGGPRKIVELPSGHLLKTGPEAIESYKLIYELIAKHLYGADRPAAEPDMARYLRQNEAEWARIKRARITDTAEFWNTHLFGAGEDVEGYDMFLYNPDYCEFIKRQARLLAVQPGDRVADLGCGTGNLVLAMLEEFSPNGIPLWLTCCDLVPRAVQRTKEKVMDLIGKAGGRLDAVRLDFRVVDLEAARLAPLQEFLSGRLYGPLALAGRIEGIETATLRKIAADYGPRLHEIIRGGRAAVEEVRKLCPALDDTEAETILELSLAARFLKDETLPEDLRPGRQTAADAGDLAFSRLDFGRGSRDCRIALPSGAFDKIGSSIVLPYLFDAASAVREFHRILAPGGVIVLSSPKPNFDSSKSYLEEARSLAQRSDLDERQKERLLRSLYELGAFISHVLEMADEGRFRFFTPGELAELMRAAGFVNIRTSEALGDPPTAAIVRAEKER